MHNTQNSIDLIAHCLEFMSSKEALMELFENKGIQFKKTYTFKNFVSAFEEASDLLSIEDITSFYRSRWKATNTKLHIDNLKSGLLFGHDWHGAMPSFLHRCIQDRVRECCNGIISLEDYLNIGSDIFKHEYFMVATHDLCESSVILSNENVIPPIGRKSVTDFIYNSIPYDIKVSSHPTKWQDKAGKMTVAEKKQLAFELYEGADRERMRKVADGCRHNWGLNRMYYLVSDQNKWLSDPKETVQFLLDNLDDTSNYFDITVNGYDIHICLIDQ